MLIGNNFKVKEDIKAINGSVIKKGTYVYCNGVGWNNFNLDDEENNYVVDYKEANKLERI